MVVKDAVSTAQKPLSESLIKTKSIDAVQGNKTCLYENRINSNRARARARARTHTHTHTRINRGQRVKFSNVKT